MGLSEGPKVLTSSMQNSRWLSERPSGDVTWPQGGKGHGLDMGQVLEASRTQTMRKNAFLSGVSLGKGMCPNKAVKRHMVKTRRGAEVGPKGKLNAERQSCWPEILLKVHDLPVHQEYTSHSPLLLCLPFTHAVDLNLDAPYLQNLI